MVRAVPGLNLTSSLERKLVNLKSHKHLEMTVCK